MLGGAAGVALERRNFAALTEIRSHSDESDISDPMRANTAPH